MITTADTTPRLEVRGITKSFPGVRALNSVSLRLMPGEVLSVVGENGAGKSTLMKILAGVHSPDTGSLFVNGRPVVLRSVRDAMGHGIALIHQELNLADNLEIGTISSLAANRSDEDSSTTPPSMPPPQNSCDASA